MYRYNRTDRESLIDVFTHLLSNGDDETMRRGILSYRSWETLIDDDTIQ